MTALRPTCATSKGDKAAQLTARCGVGMWGQPLGALGAGSEHAGSTGPPPCFWLPRLIPGEEGYEHVRSLVTRFVPGAGEEQHVPPRLPKPPHDAGTRGCQQARAVQRGRVTGWLLFPVPREAGGTVTRSESHPAAAHEPGEPSCGVGKFLMSSARQTGQLLTATSRGRATCRAAHAPLLPASQNPFHLHPTQVLTRRQTDRQEQSGGAGRCLPHRGGWGCHGVPQSTRLPPLHAKDPMGFRILQGGMQKHLTADHDAIQLVWARGDEKCCILLKLLWNLGQAGGNMWAGAGSAGRNPCPNGAEGTSRPTTYNQPRCPPSPKLPLSIFVLEGILRYSQSCPWRKFYTPVML